MLASSTSWPAEPPRFRLGPFSVDLEGRLLPAVVTTPRFAIRWRDCTVCAALHGGEHGSTEGALALAVLVAKVPSSAEAGTAAETRRDRTFALLRALPPLLPPAWRLTLTPDHHIALAARQAVTLPISADRMLTQLTMFLLALDPYLELLHEQGSCRPARAFSVPTE